MGRLNQACALVAVAITTICALCAPASAAKLTVLYSFCASANCADGSIPRGDLFLDAAGDLYGLATSGGANGRGAAFRLAHDPVTGKWKYHLLYSFCAKADCADGGGPQGKIFFDSSGNLYGVTFNPGTVFALIPNANRTKWRAETLHRFCLKAGCIDGAMPTGGLTYPGAKAGGLYDGVSPIYGETFGGGAAQQGTIFALAPEAGRWKLHKIHDFCTETENCDLTDGSQPNGGLLIDATGNLFGSSAGGGPDFSGTIFEFSPRVSGKWKEKILYSFCAPGCDSGQSPTGIIRDQDGDAYGMTAAFGPNGKGGTLFELAADGSFSLLHAFCSAADCSDGHQPGAAPLRDAAGNLYGTTIIGGGNDRDEGHLGGGVVFERTASGDFTVLHAFCAEANCTDGAAPWAGLTMDSAGNLFGTTSAGGKFGGGTIFEVTP